MTISNCRAVIFDLDGTLLNTLADIADAANRVLADRGFTPHTYEAYRWFVGDGARKLISRVLPEPHRIPQLIDECLEAFLADYSENWDQSTRPYDGITGLIETLKVRKTTMAVVTNKPHNAATAMVARYFKDNPFDPVLGQRDGIPKKPDPQQALTAADKMGVPPGNCIFIGDSNVDMQTARNAEMKAVGAVWGFRTKEELVAAGAEVVIDSPLELLEVIR